MPYSKTFSLYPASIISIGAPVHSLTLNDAYDSGFEVPDAQGNDQSATLDGNPATVTSVQSSTLLATVVYIPPGGGLAVSVQTTIIRVRVNGTNYYIYPNVPNGSTIVSVSLQGVLSFNTNTSLPLCLAADTLVQTPGGQRRVGDLAVGDLVETLDGGAQPVRWIGRLPLRFGPDTLNDRFRPVLIAPGALGEGLPLRPLRVSPQHAVLLRDWRVELMFGEEEVLAPAHALVDGQGIRIDTQCTEVDYIHLLFDDHQVLFAEGAMVESLYAGDMTLAALEPAARAELVTLFPELIATDLPRRRRRLNTARGRRRPGGRDEAFGPESSPLPPEHPAGGPKHHSPRPGDIRPPSR